MKKILFALAFSLIGCLNANCIILMLDDGSDGFGSTYYAPVTSSASAGWTTIDEINVVLVNWQITPVNSIQTCDLEITASELEEELAALQFAQAQQQQQTLFNTMSNILKTIRDMMRNAIRNLG